MVRVHKRIAPLPLTQRKDEATQAAF